MRQRTTGQWWRRQESAGLRLVVEGAEGALDIADFRAFRQAGFDVAQCDGPSCDGACPTQRGEPCSLVGNADVVLTTLDAGTAVAAAVRALHPEVPVVVEVRREPGAVVEVPPGCTALPFPTSVDGQVRVLRRAATRPDPPG